MCCLVRCDWPSVTLVTPHTPSRSRLRGPSWETHTWGTPWEPWRRHLGDQGTTSPPVFFRKGASCELAAGAGSHTHMGAGSYTNIGTGSHTHMVGSKYSCERRHLLMDPSRAHIWVRIRVWEHRQAHMQVWEHIRALIQVLEHIRAHIEVREHIRAHIRALVCAFFCPGSLPLSLGIDPRIKLTLF